MCHGGIDEDRHTFPSAPPHAMLTSGIPLGSYWLAWITTVGTLWVLFSRAEAIASHDLKLKVKRWLRQDHDGDGHPTSWPQMFIGIFDAVFGEKHLTWKCFLRSCLASFIAISICFSLWMVLRFDHFLISFHSMGWWDLAYIVILGGVICNFIPDYVSLLETRYLLNWIQQRPSLGLHVVILLVDVLITGFIFIASIIVFTLTVRLLTIGMDATLSDISVIPENFFKMIKTLVFIEEVGVGYSGISILSVFFYSTYFTSMWLWLYLLAGALSRLVVGGLATIQWTKRFVNIDEKPILSIGTMSILLVSLGFLLYAPFALDLLNTSPVQASG